MGRGSRRAVPVPIPPSPLLHAPSSLLQAPCSTLPTFVKFFLHPKCPADSRNNAQTPASARNCFSPAHFRPKTCATVSLGTIMKLENDLMNVTLLAAPLSAARSPRLTGTPKHWSVECPTTPYSCASINSWSITLSPSSSWLRAFVCHCSRVAGDKPNIVAYNCYTILKLAMRSLPYHRSHMQTTLFVSTQIEPAINATTRAGYQTKGIQRACHRPALNCFFTKLQIPVIGSHPESSGVIFDPAKSLPVPAGGRRPSLWQPIPCHVDLKHTPLRASRVWPIKKSNPPPQRTRHAIL